MTRPRFLLDEHVSRAVQNQLLQSSPDIDVLIVGQSGAPAKGTSDPDLLHWIEESGYILVTSNRRTIPVHLQTYFDGGGQVPGILFIRRHASVGQVVEALFLVWEVSEAEEFQNRVLYIPL